MDNRINLIIIDGAQNNRRQQMARAFRGLADLYRYNIEAKTIEKDIDEGLWEELPPGEEAPRFELMLIHGGDSQYQDVVRTDVRIWYSGGEGYDKRAENGEYQIYRSILSSEEALTQAEAMQLLAFLENRQAMPPFLCAPGFNPAVEQRIDFFFQHLLNPPEGADWDHILSGHDALFADVPATWGEFKLAAKQLVASGGALSASDTNYHRILQALTEKVFA